MIVVSLGPDPATARDAAIAAARRADPGGDNTTWHDADSPVSQLAASAGTVGFFGPRVMDDPSRLPVTRRSHLVRADRDGYVTEVRAGAVGVAATVLGAGRERAEDAVDHAVGVLVLARPGDRVRADEPVLEAVYRDAQKLGDALPLLEDAVRIGDAPPAPAPLVLETVR